MQRDDTLSHHVFARGGRLRRVVRGRGQQRDGGLVAGRPRGGAVPDRPCRGLVCGEHRASEAVLFAAGVRGYHGIGVPYM